MSKLSEIDEIAENDMYCVAPSDDDLQAFAEHAQKRKKIKKTQNIHLSMVKYRQVMRMSSQNNFELLRSRRKQ